MQGITIDIQEVDLQAADVKQVKIFITAMKNGERQSLIASGLGGEWVKVAEGNIRPCCLKIDISRQLAKELTDNGKKPLITVSHYEEVFKETEIKKEEKQCKR